MHNLSSILIVLVAMWVMLKLRFWSDSPGCVLCGAKRPDQHGPNCPERK